jgi:MFS transporter, PAT family, beta-lactamase induction signal transducer AmpG
MTEQAAPARGWMEACKVFLDRRVIALFFLGLAAGLPYLLVFSTLSTWLREIGTDRATIGFLSWVSTFYSIKVLWAPVVDRMPIPLLTRYFGRRRSWMLLAQLGIIIGLLGMASGNPATGLTALVSFALLTSFASATQDIAIDAYRIEAAPADLQGPLAGSYNFGYRVGLLLAGAGALYIADFVSWFVAYTTMAAVMLVGPVTVLLVSEPGSKVDRAALLQEEHIVQYVRRFAHLSPTLRAVIGWIYGAIVCPFIDFFRRIGWFALVILAFIAIYKLSDVIMGVMASPFYIDVGFSKSDIASVTKIYGFAMSVLGGLIGGILVVRMGVVRPLVIGAVMVGLPNLLFALLAHQGIDQVMALLPAAERNLPLPSGSAHDFWLLVLAISADNLGGGIAGTVLIAYLSSLTSAAYTATQYALFSSLMSLPGRFIGGWSGVMVENIGYRDFFIMTAAIGLPAVGLAWYIARQTYTGRTAPVMSQAQGRKVES